MRAKDPMLKVINMHLEAIQRYGENTSGHDRFRQLKVLEKALDDVDKVLTGFVSPAGGARKTADDKDTPDSQHPSTELTAKTRHEKERETLVQEVLRCHFQEVLRLLNETDKRAAKTEAVTLVVASENPELVRPRAAGPNIVSVVGSARLPDFTE